MFHFGVDSYIWTERFLNKDLWIIPKAKELGFEVIDLAIGHPFEFPVQAVLEEKDRAGIQCVTTTTLGADTDLISPDPAIRQRGIEHMKKMVDINRILGSKILAGVIYAGWGCLSGKPRTEQEWEWSVNAMREITQYAADNWDGILAVEGFDPALAEGLMLLTPPTACSTARTWGCPTSRCIWTAST